MLALLKKLSSAYGANFAPKLYEVLRAAPYTINEFRRDSIAGMTVAVVSIPLAMALAIASGVSPAQGLYTAIVAGFFIALLGGSRYQIGGPTGAFVVVIFNVMQNYGYDGLAMTMLIAGVVLIVAGFCGWEHILSTFLILWLSVLRPVSAFCLFPPRLRICSAFR